MITFKMNEEFGSFLAVGDNAKEFLDSSVLPALASSQKVVLDFHGVNNMNSSFGIALFANLVKIEGRDVLDFIQITNASERLKAEVKSSFALGLSIRDSSSVA